MELILIAVLAIAVLGFSTYREYLASKERKDMLDRLMSKDLTDFKAGTEETDNEFGVEEDKQFIPLNSPDLLTKEQKEEIEYGGKPN